uniref:Uncharacterized protein n=1 Tax=Corvus moneduloides TaxID=1196302 RepID=A0A8U7MGX1_CORMO
GDALQAKRMPNARACKERRRSGHPPSWMNGFRDLSLTVESLSSPLQPPSALLEKMKLHQDKAGPCRVPHRARHGHLAPFLFGGTAKPWGALRNLCLQQSRVVSDVFPSTQGQKNQVTRMLVAAPVGQKDITRM